MKDTMKREREKRLAELRSLAQHYWANGLRIPEWLNAQMFAVGLDPDTLQDINLCERN